MTTNNTSDFDPAMYDSIMTIANNAGLGNIHNAYPFASGANNELIMLEYQDKKAVLKKTKAGAVQRLHNEKTVLDVTRGTIGPVIYYCDNTHIPNDCSYLIEEYVEGTHLHELSCHNASLLGTQLRIVHDFPVTNLKRELEMPSWTDYFETRLMTQFTMAKTAAPTSYLNAMDKYLNQILKYGKSIDTKQEMHQVSLIHTDLIPLNILFTDNSCKIIDWELARIDFSEWDICSVLKAFTFTDDSMNHFRDSYRREINQKRLDMVSLLHYCNVALWRMCSFYCKGENRIIKEQFLNELHTELDWIKTHLP